MSSSPRGGGVFPVQEGGDEGMVQAAHPHPLAEGDPVGEVEAMEEAAEVGAEGGGAEAEGLGDLFVAPAAGDSQGHGPLAGGEAPPGIPMAGLSSPGRGSLELQPARWERRADCSCVVAGWVVRQRGSPIRPQR